MSIAHQNTPTEYLTKAAYGKLIGRSERVVERYIKDGKLPDATKDDRGVVIIPAHVRPLDVTPTSDDDGPRAWMSNLPLRELEAAPTRRQTMDDAPFLPTLEEAGKLLEITPSQVAALRRQGVLAGVKVDGRWRITAASIRALAGISTVTDYWEDPATRAWARRAIDELAPMIEDSAATISIVPTTETDIKFALELGLSIMYDKPIILAIAAGQRIPDHLRRVADDIVEWNGDQAAIMAAISRVMDQVDGR